MKIFHKHEWGWTKLTKRHIWSERLCKKCGKKERVVPICTLVEIKDKSGQVK